MSPQYRRKALGSQKQEALLVSTGMCCFAFFDGHFRPFSLKSRTERAVEDPMVQSVNWTPFGMEERSMADHVSGIFKRTKIAVVLAVVGLVFSAFDPAVSAETVEEGPLKRNGWTISVAPYLWGTALDGELGLEGIETDVDVPIKDILKSLNSMIMLDLSVHKGRLGFFFNPLYANLGSEKNLTILEGTLFRQNANVDATLRMLILGFGVGYRLGPFPLGAQENGRTPAVTVEPYFGGRWTEMDVQLYVTTGEIRSYDQNTGWVDPVVGLMTVWDLFPRWNIMLSGDAGGFGVGTDLSWSATLLAGYRFHFSPRIMGNVLFGYRTLYQDFESDDGARFKYDTYMHGPYVSVSIDFGQWVRLK
jgi:hypothetical protein